MQERLLVFLVRDLEGRSVRLVGLSRDDFDTVGGLLRLPAADGKYARAKLGRDTMEAFRQYVLSRTDKDRALFVTREGQRFGESELLEMANRLAGKSGLEFDVAEQRFRAIKSDVPRLVSKTASR